MEGPHSGQISPRPPSLAEQYTLALEFAESDHTGTNHADYCRSTRYQAIIVESNSRSDEAHNNHSGHRCTKLKNARLHDELEAANAACVIVVGTWLDLLDWH